MSDKKLIVELRTRTGAGIADCVQALAEAENDLERAQEILRKRGVDKASKKADRATGEGVIGSYVHNNKKIGSMVSLSCETDFVARTEDFQKLAHDIAMQIAATSPLYVKPEDVPEDIISKQRDIFREQMTGESKSPEMLEKIVEGKIQKYFEEVCLLKQAFFKDEDITVEDYIKQKIAVVGENITVKKFVKFEL